MMTRRWCVLFTGVLGVAAAAASPAAPAQEPPATSPASGAAQTQPSPADEAYAPLRRDVRNLVDSLRNQGGIRPEDEPLVRAMRDRAAAFSRQFPDDPRGVAIELQISIWLKDEDLVAELFSKLVRLSPDSPQVALGHIEYLMHRNRFADAVTAIRSHNFDIEKTPRASALLAKALFAEHEFEQANAALNAIPSEALERDLFLKVQDVEPLRKPIEEAPALWAQEQALREQERAVDDLPRAVIRTSRGDITVELFENQAPNTVANFISLVEENYYDGTRFHRVIPAFMAQGGDPNSREGATGAPGEGGPGYNIRDEIDHPEHRKHFTGSLAMAKTAQPNTAGSQFYLTVMPTPHLNSVHTVFGRVLEGLDVARSIEQNDVIESIEITRKRDHEYQPEKLPLPGVTVTPEIPPTTTQPEVEPGTQPEPMPVFPDPPQTQPETSPTDPATAPGSPDSD